MRRARFAISAAFLAWGGSRSTIVARIIFAELVGAGPVALNVFRVFECTRVLTVCAVTIHLSWGNQRKKQQTQIQTNQITVTTRKVTQDTGNINNFWKRQSLVFLSMPEDLLLFLTTRINKMAVWKTTYVSEHLNTDQYQLTKCFALVACFACCSLDDSS